MSIFKPRSNITPVNTEGKNQSNDKKYELTKNNHYCMSKLPALPTILKSKHHQFNNGYSECSTNYSLVINDTSIYVWHYTTTDTTPMAIQFPIESTFKLPLAILTRPINAIEGQDPGLIIIDSISGLVKFYQSVQHAPTLGLINDKSLQLKINLQKDEVITLAENVEPAGITVATSLNRCILITLRDNKNKPHLSTLELLSNSKLFGIFKSNLNEIVSIRSGRLLNNSTVQEIMTLDSAGTFHLFNYNLLSPGTVPRPLKQNIYIDIDGYPSSNNDIMYLDIWKLSKSENLKDVYLSLCQINNRELFLITLKIDQSGVLLYGSHRLNTAIINGIHSKPKLYLPKPYHTAFIILDNSIILTDLNTSYIETQNTLPYYKPRWEDVVRLKSSVEVIGSGYENQTENINPSVILITNNFGVLRLEKYPELSTETEIDPIMIVKSHIEQGIFFTNSNEVNFDLSQTFDSSTIQKAVTLINEELLNSTNSYLPTKNTTIDLITLKVRIFKSLINYVERNFDLPHVLPDMVENLERSDVAYNFLNTIQSNDELKKVYASKFQISNTEWITNIDAVLIRFFELIDEQTISLIPLIVAVLYKGIYQNDINYNVRTEWLYSTDLLKRLEAVFMKEYKNKSANDEDALQLIETFYYLANKAIAHNSYLKWYNEEKSYWIDILLKINHVEKAIELCEKYHDFASLAKILDLQRDAISFDNLNYGYYFEQYGYEFAKNVYNYYLQQDLIQKLTLDFTNYKHYLFQWFEENPRLTSKISWIRYLLDEQFIQASDALILNAESKDHLTNQRLKYSIAKLASIAGGDEEVQDLNKELKLIKYQDIIKQSLGSVLSIINSEFYINNYMNEAVVKDSQQESFMNSFFKNFIDDYQLSYSQLIEILSTFKPSLLNYLNFSYGLEVAKLMSNQSKSNYYSIIVFLRLLTIGNDEFESKNSILYKTLINHRDLIDLLVSFLKNPQIKDEYEIDFKIEKYNKVLLKRLIGQLKNDQVRSNVESIIEQVQFDI